MKREDLSQITKNLGKDWFDLKDLRKLFPEEKNLKTSVKRLKDDGFIKQITRGVYSLSENSVDIEKIATQIYYPSYISFESALAKYGIINQGRYGLTLATSRHSKKITLGNIECEYSKIKNDLFFGFDLIGETYIAKPEKAFLDQLYLISLGKRNRNTEEWYLDSLDKKTIAEFLKKYPKSVQKLSLATL